MDTAISISSGLPPLISDDNIWDVKPISELKDKYVGIPAGDVYLKDVKDGRKKPENTDDPNLRQRRSMVDVHYVVARAMHWLCSKSIYLNKNIGS